MKKTWFIVLLVIAVLISGCTTTTTTRPAEPTQTPETTTPAPTQTPAQVSVAIKSSTFVPEIVEISKGTTVTWTNDDGVPHTVTSISGAFNSGNINPGQTYSYTFNQAGPFEYSCTNHPGMTHGKVIVT